MREILTSYLHYLPTKSMAESTRSTEFPPLTRYDNPYDDGGDNTKNGPGEASRKDRRKNRKKRAEDRKEEGDTGGEGVDDEGEEEEGGGKEDEGDEMGEVCPLQAARLRRKRLQCKTKEMCLEPKTSKRFPCIREPDMTHETPEMTALRRLKSRLMPYFRNPLYKGLYEVSDDDLLAWLRTLDLNVYMSEARILQHFTARRRLGLDTILKDYEVPMVLQYHYGCGLCGVDREKRPIWYELLGYQDMNGLINVLDMEKLIKFKFYQCEKLKEAARKSGMTQILVIVDMADIVGDQIFGSVIEVWTKYINLVQQHYPYLIKELIILNRPPIATEFTLALRPYINRLTWSKVTVLGKHFLPYLLERIEKHEIPAYLGGYKCDVDFNPYCNSWLNWPGKVPKWMYVTNPAVAANVHKFNIPGGQQLVKETHVATPKSKVIWNFIKVNHPFTLSVYFNLVRNDCCVERKLIRCDTKDPVSKVAGVVMERAGRYLIVFDNNCDFAHAAKGFYKMSIIQPDWLKAKYAKQKPLGDRFNMNHPSDGTETELRKWKFLQDPHCTWDKDWDI